MTRISTADSPGALESTDGVTRRMVLKAGAVTVGALALSAPASAREGRSHDEPIRAVDRPIGFGVEVLARASTFPDDVAATFRTKYDGGGTIVSNLPNDASNVWFARVTWKPEGTSGWHTHPGPVIVSVVEGEVEVTNERDCIARTYAAGESFVDPGQGNVHIASNPSTTDRAVAYATFLGVPDGAAPTVSVPPVDCG